MNTIPVRASLTRCFFVAAVAVLGLHCSSNVASDGDVTTPDDDRIGSITQALDPEESGPGLYPTGAAYGLPEIAEDGDDDTAMASSVPPEDRDFVSVRIPVRNQGSTNLCWAFSVVGAMETNMVYRGRTQTSAGAFNLSERSLWNCAGAKSSQTGYAHTAAVWARRRGVNGESNDDCTAEKKFHVTRVRKIATGANGFASILDIKRAVLRHGAVVTWLWGSNSFQAHRGTGVFRDNADRNNLKSNRGHFVVIIGYSPWRNAFLVKNSWGTDWGDGGYGWVNYFSANIGRWPFWLEADYGDGVGGKAPNPVTGGYGSAGGTAPPPPLPPPPPSPPPPPDTTPPWVQITEPVPGVWYGRSSQGVSANAGDNVGVARVDFYVGGQFVGSSSAAPYSVGWQAYTFADGNYYAEAIAYDAMGNSARSGNWVQVDRTRPNVALTAPASTTTTVSDVFSPAANASDGFSGISKVYFYMEQPAPIEGTPETKTVTATSTSETTTTSQADVMSEIPWWIKPPQHFALGNVTAAPYTLSFDTGWFNDGAYDLFAAAYDVAGNVSRVTKVITISNPNAIRVNMGSLGTSWLYGTVMVSGAARAQRGLQRVELWEDAKLVASQAGDGSPSTASYSFSWATGGESLGTTYRDVSLVTKAFDRAGGVGTTTQTVRVKKNVCASGYKMCGCCIPVSVNCSEAYRYCGSGGGGGATAEL